MLRTTSGAKRRSDCLCRRCPANRARLPLLPGAFYESVAKGRDSKLAANERLKAKLAG
jgi:hypothetical protein